MDRCSVLSEETGSVPNCWVSDRLLNSINVPIFYRQKD